MKQSPVPHTPYTQPDPTVRIRLFRGFIIPFFRVLYHILSRPIVEGSHNIPKHGSYLITVNHLSYYDPPLALAFWPCRPEVLGAASQMARPIIGHIMRWYGTHPVRRDTSSSDFLVVRLALTILQSGQPLLIMPEGRRNPDGLGQAQLGAAYLATKANVPIVPVGITGTENMISSLLRGRRQVLRMIIGKPYHLPSLEGSNRKQALQACTDLIMQRIAQHLPETYRGKYPISTHQ